MSEVERQIKGRYENLIPYIDGFEYYDKEYPFDHKNGSPLHLNATALRMFDEIEGEFGVLKNITEAHQGQTRKYTGEPYWYHCLEVALITCRTIGAYGGYERLENTNPVDVILACLAHDLIEDTATTMFELIFDFNFSVEAARMVAHLTDMYTSDLDMNRKQRKQLECQRYARLSDDLAPAVHMIKCADLISNTKSIKENDSEFYETYVEEARNLVNNGLFLAPERVLRMVIYRL